MQDVLEIIDKELTKLGVEYYYFYNTSPVVTYPYVTGEYTESDYVFEDGAHYGDMLLEVWNRGKIMPILQVVEIIKDHFKDFRYVEGNKTFHISYTSAVPIRTNEETLNKYEVHLDVYYWEGA